VEQREQIDADDVRAAARLVDLRLTPERVDTLRRTLAEFVEGFAAVWALDAGDRQPATLGFDDEDAGR